MALRPRTAGQPRFSEYSESWLCGSSAASAGEAADVRACAWLRGAGCGLFAFVTDKLVPHEPAAVLLGQYERGMNSSDRDDTPVREALSFPFMVLVNHGHVRADEPHLGRRLAHHSRCGISRVGVKTAEERLDRIGSHPAAAKGIDPHRVRGVDRTFSVRIVRAHGFGAV